MSERTPDAILAEKWLDAWSLRQLEEARAIYDMQGHEEAPVCTLGHPLQDTL